MPPCLPGLLALYSYLLAAIVVDDWTEVSTEKRPAVLFLQASCLGILGEWTKYEFVMLSLDLTLLWCPGHTGSKTGDGRILPRTWKWRRWREGSEYLLRNAASRGNQQHYRLKAVHSQNGV